MVALLKKGAVSRVAMGRGRHFRSLAEKVFTPLWVGGDAGASATLYGRHARAAYSLAYRMMGEKQAAEDLVQDALLKVWRGAESYRAERGSARTWILSIVHNRGIDQLRSLASRRRTQDRVEASAPTSQPSEAFAETWRNSQRRSEERRVGKECRSRWSRYH